MIILSLNAGDKIHLPTTTELNGKEHKLIPCDSPKCNQLKGLFLIQRDLSQIKSSIEKFIQNPSHHFEHLRSLVITYRKLWKETGSRYVKLEVSRNLKNLRKIF